MTDDCKSPNSLPTSFKGDTGKGLPGEGGGEPVHDGMFASLQHRNYRIFFFAQLVSLTGTWMQMVAEGWLVYSLTRSPMSLGIVRFLHTLPVTLLTFLGGLPPKSAWLAMRPSQMAPNNSPEQVSAPSASPKSLRNAKMASLSMLEARKSFTSSSTMM